MFMQEKVVFPITRFLQPRLSYQGRSSIGIIFAIYFWLTVSNADGLEKGMYHGQVSQDKYTLRVTISSRTMVRLRIR